MTLNDSVCMMRIIFVFANRMIFVLNVFFTILNLIIVTSVFQGANVFKVTQQIPMIFFCLCPSCHQGHRCQFNLQPFGFTFDSLLVRYSTSMKIVYLSLILLLLMVGFLNNFCSFITFKRPTPRRYATGTYLLIIACLNQLALFCLFLKFIQITFGISSVVSCRLVSYLLSVLTRSTYWLTSWVTVDRILIILYPNSPRLKDAHLAIRLSVATLIILLAMHIHETIYYTAIEDHHTSSPICVIDLGTRFVSVYNQMSTPIHYILPFLIQTISITLLIVFSTRSRVRATGQRSSFYQALKTQFENQKELYVTPLLVIFSILPQAITTFSLACKDLNEGQRNLLLYAYLLSHAPASTWFHSICFTIDKLQERVRSDINRKENISGGC